MGDGFVGHNKNIFVSCSLKNTIKNFKNATRQTFKTRSRYRNKSTGEFFNETLGFCPNSVLTMQHRPEIRKAFINLNKAVMSNKGSVTSALKRMMTWVGSNACGCRYCQAHAIRATARYGAEEEKLNHI